MNRLVDIQLVNFEQLPNLTILQTIMSVTGTLVSVLLKFRFKKDGIIGDLPTKSR